MTKKEFIVKESEGFRLRVAAWECLSPKGLFSVEYIQESLDDKGNIADTSTYNFHMTRDEIKALSEGLLTI